MRFSIAASNDVLLIDLSPLDAIRQKLTALDSRIAECDAKITTASIRQSVEKWR